MNRRSTDERPLLLDLFCGAGGCSVGYVHAGFRVIGVDLNPQPHYPCEFHQGDAIEALEILIDKGEYAGVELEEISAIHASPPCQKFSRLAVMHPDREHPDLIAPARDRLKLLGLPYVIENVEGAPLDGITLCGSHFGLGVERGWLRRHRIFECSFPIGQPRCAHPPGVPAVGVYGHGGHSGKHRMLAKAEAADAMGIQWMNRDELAQSIPPAYTRHIGYRLLDALRRP